MNTYERWSAERVKARRELQAKEQMENALLDKSLSDRFNAAAKALGVPGITAQKPGWFKVSMKWIGRQDFKKRVNLLEARLHELEMGDGT